jgi:hypothetical protein
MIQKQLVANVPTIFRQVFTEVSNPLPLDQQPQSPAEPLLAQPEQQQGENVATSHTVATIANSELLSCKHLTSRVKQLSKLFRYAQEDIATILKAQEQARLVQSQHQKKQVTAVLKAVQRIGYPRSNYPDILAKGGVDGGYLLTWRQFAKECGCGLEDKVEEVKEMFQAVYRRVYPPAAAPEVEVSRVPACMTDLLLGAALTSFTS